jgi:hypothetical protein
VKKPWLTFLLSFLIAGAGLAYLGKWGWAILNFGGVILLGRLLLMFSPVDSLGVVSTCLAASSGSLAMAMAPSMNAKLGAQGGVQQTNPPAQAVPYGMPKAQYAARPEHRCSPLRTFLMLLPLAGNRVNASYAPQASLPASNYLAPAAAIPEPSGAPSPLPVPAGRPKFCGECGAPSQILNSCTQCGKPLQRRNHCPRCGATVEPGKKFCRGGTASQ